MDFVMQTDKVSKAHANVKKVKNCQGHYQSIKYYPEIFLAIDGND